MSINCQICCETKTLNKKNKEVACVSCDFKVCNACQQTYAAPTCMNCRAEFELAYLERQTSKTFIQKVIIPLQIRQVMQQEKNLIDATMPYIEWLKESEEHQKALRKGVYFQLREKPAIVFASTRITNCANINCRGTISVTGTCSMCKRLYCPTCLEQCDSLEAHTCNKDTLESIRAIQMETRNCPNCATNIFRSQGCSHMHCTHCGAHFDWDTNQILTNSTNHHYRNLANLMNRGDNIGYCAQVFEDPRIPRDLLESHAPPDILYALYDVPKMIHTYCVGENNPQKARTLYNDRNTELRVRYITGKISEQQWTKLVYQNHKQMKLTELYGGVFSIYFNAIDEIQSFINETQPADFTAISAQISTIIEQCNKCFASIYEEYKTPTTTLFVINDGVNTLPMQTLKPASKNHIKTEHHNSAVELRDYQIAHYEKLVRILNTSYFAIDLSPLGSGKTYTASYLAQQSAQYKHAIIVAPASLKPKWEQVFNGSALESAYILSYNDLVGKKYIQPKCGLVYRNDYTKPQQIRAGEFRGQERIIEVVEMFPTDLLVKLAAENTLLVIDEIQHIKNETSAQTAAARELILAIKSANEAGAHSHAILMSGSPIDTDQQAVTFFRNTGIQKSRELLTINPHTGVKTQTGYLEIVNFCRTLDPRHSVNTDLSSQDSVDWYYPVLLRLFTGPIKQHLSAAMPMPPTDNTVYPRNLICRLEDPDVERAYVSAIKDLVALASSRDKNRHIAIIQSMLIIESCKVHVFIKLAKQKLAEHPNNKVVLALNYADSIQEISEQLAEYAPLILNGKVTPAARHAAIDKFQQPDAQHRLIIANQQVICAGIDLDDKHGGFPRTCICSPNYSSINLYQLSRRFSRSTDSKSDAYLDVLYLTTGSDSTNGRELHVLTRLQTKGGVMKNVAIEQADAGVIFPCDYPTVHLDPNRYVDNLAQALGSLSI